VRPSSRRRASSSRRDLLSRERKCAPPHLSVGRFVAPRHIACRTRGARLRLFVGRSSRCHVNGVHAPSFCLRRLIIFFLPRAIVLPSAIGYYFYWPTRSRFAFGVWYGLFYPYLGDPSMTVASQPTQGDVSKPLACTSFRVVYCPLGATVPYLYLGDFSTAACFAFGRNDVNSTSY